MSLNATYKGKHCHEKLPFGGGKIVGWAALGRGWFFFVQPRYALCGSRVVREGASRCQTWGEKVPGFRAVAWGVRGRIGGKIDRF